MGFGHTNNFIRPGNIFRACPAAVLQQALDSGAYDRGVIVAEGFDYEIIDKAYAPYENLSLLVSLKSTGDIEKKVIGSVTECLKADYQFENDWTRLAEIFRKPSLQMISFTITEKGYGVAPHDLERGLTPVLAMGKVAALLFGGGVQSMVKVFSIVCLSSCYSGMFNGTGLLEGFRGGLNRLSKRILPFGSILLTSIITVMISCNQALAIMLPQQLCVDTEKDPETMASHLENTVVVIAPLIPWSIAGAVPLASVGAPTACILTACYLYLLPLWNYAAAIRRSVKK